VLEKYKNALAAKRAQASAAKRISKQVSNSNFSSSHRQSNAAEDRMTGSNAGGVVSVNPNRIMQLKDVLAVKDMCAVFEEFLIEELQVENLLFLQDIDAWKRAYFGVAPTARLARARRLFRVYISSDGQFQINISSKCSKQLTTLFADKAIADVPLTQFDEAVDEISLMLQFGGVRRFQESKKYKEFRASFGGGPV
jgi:hypothetical protein